jgi:hypothetical protein
VTNLVDEPSEAAAVGELAREVLASLYHALSGQPPKAVRAYAEDDALLLLLRFDPAELGAASDSTLDSPLDTTFIALPSMIASAVHHRTGRTLYPGNLSVSPERGLAVFAFSAFEEAQSTISASVLFPALALARPQRSDLDDHYGLT